MMADIDSLYKQIGGAIRFISICIHCCRDCFLQQCVTFPQSIEKRFMSFLLSFFSSSMVNVVVLVLVVKGSGHLSDKYPQRSHYRFLTCDVTIKSYFDLYLGLSPSLFLIFFFLFVCLRHFDGKNHSFCRYFFGIYLLT